MPKQQEFDERRARKRAKRTRDAKAALRRQEKMRGDEFLGPGPEQAYAVVGRMIDGGRLKLPRMRRGR